MYKILPTYLIIPNLLRGNQTHLLYTYYYLYYLFVLLIDPIYKYNILHCIMYF